jgi:hypothetical protein
MNALGKWSRATGQDFFGLSLPVDFDSLFGAFFGDPLLASFLPLSFAPSFDAFVELSDEELLVPVSLDPLGLLSLFVSFFEPSLELDSPPESLLLATFFLSPDLKSVSYQPPPFKRNATAEIFFFRRSFPHEGHCVSGASLIRCSDSNSYSQPPH